MTGLKDAYRSGEENYLGKTGQVRKEVKAVTAQKKPELKPKLRAAITEDREEKLSALTATRRETWPKIAGDP